MRKIKIGIVGAGTAFGYYRSAIKASKLIKISGIYDIKKLKTNDYKDIKLCISLDDLFKTKPNVIAILTSSLSRYEIGRKILNKKISIILEKPPTETLDQFDNLLKIARNKNCFIFGALHSRYTSTHIFVREKIHVTKEETFHDNFGKLKKIELCRFDPYIKNNILRDNLPEPSSGLDSWPNIFAELTLFSSNYQVEKVFNQDASFAPKVTDVKTKIQGKIQGGGSFIGKTDWTLGVSEKITTLTFSDAQIIMDHTLQKVFVEQNGNKKEIADFNHIGERMECEFYRMFQEIYEIENKLKKSNEIITRKILSDTLECQKRIM